METNIHFQSGLEKCKKGQFTEALPFFHQSLQIQPNHLPTLYNRGKVFHKLGQFDKAAEDFSMAILIEPYNADLYSDRGVALHMNKQGAKALKDFDKAASLEPQNPYRYSSRAFVKAAIGDAFGAIDDYKKAIELDPEDAVALNNLGMLEEKLGYTSAKDRFKKADNLTEREKESYPKSKMQPSDPVVEKEVAKPKKELTDLPEIIPAQPKPPPTHWEIIQSVFTSKETFKEFVSFVKNGLKRK